jgi:hypothetical protein
MSFRLLGLCLLISLCVAISTAQSSPVTSLNSSQPASAQSQSTESGTIRLQFAIPFVIDVQSLFGAVPDNILNDSESGKTAQLLRAQRAYDLYASSQEDTFCLSLRTYRVARVSPDSDVTRPASYSTCQPSSRFQVKTAVESREIPSR